MLESAILMDWAMTAARWLHVITAIAWIGSSFYFIALDLGLRKADDLPEGAHGEEWQVHGGGFYHIRKYLVAPAALPEHLIWFKWESYATWLSGFMLLCLLYYGHADLYLIDPAKWDVPAWGGILASLGALAFGWLAYDRLCKSRFGEDNTRLMILLYIILVALAVLFQQIFTGRAAFLHLGALTATIMSANVFMIIIPNQKIVVADLRAGRTPDAKYGKIAKQRSTHNNYLTLPVLFMMLSNHWPLAFGTDYAWAIAALVFLMGVTIRHFFNTKHARKGMPWWTWGVTVALFLACVALSWLGRAGDEMPEEMELSALPPSAARFAEDPHFEQARDVVMARCSMCHTAAPYWDGIAAAPRGVVLDTDAAIARQARAIYLQAGVTRAMPPANITYIEPQERAILAAWFESAR